VSDFLSHPSVNRRGMSVTIVHTNRLSFGTHNGLFISPYANAPAYFQEDPRAKLEGSFDDRHSQRKMLYVDCN
jgi:hypothetical protein